MPGNFPKKHLCVFVFLISVFSVSASYADATSNKFTHKVITRDFSQPWAVEFIDANSALVTEKRGSLWHFDLAKNKKTAISGVPPVTHRGQGGLLDIALDPAFNQSQSIYLCYAHKNKKGSTTRLAKARLVKHTLQDLQVLFTAEPYYSPTRHYGCRIAFDSESLLYLSVGDRGERDLAQSLETHNGKIIRLTRDGDVPESNPFVGDKKALPEIYSYGHRNPQGLFYDTQRGRLIAVEHGPRGGDEINIVEAGKNYGWPIITYGQEYRGGKIGEGITHKAGMEQPLYHYTPSIAPAGAEIYTGEDLPGAKGNLFIGALALRHLNYISLDASGAQPKEERLFIELGQRVRDVKQSPDKKLYFVTDGGWLVRVE